MQASRGVTMSRRRNASKAVRHRVLQRDGGRCRYCGHHAHTVDHIIPASKGGTNHVPNLVAACGDCNNRRGSSLYFERYPDGRCEVFIVIISTPTDNFPLGRRKIIGGGPQDTRLEAERTLQRRVIGGRHE